MSHGLHWQLKASRLRRYLLVELHATWKQWVSSFSSVLNSHRAHANKHCVLRLPHLSSRPPLSVLVFSRFVALFGIRTKLLSL